VLTSAARFDMLSPSQYESLTYYMARLNKYAKEAMDNFRVNSCTDITGFGFAGHAY
jgi:selenide,water dikinase